MYGSRAQAIIHPPECFKLPDMIIDVFHMEKQTSLGEEEALNVYLRLKTATGSALVPVAVVQDNPNTVAFWKAMMAGTLAGQNV